MWQEKPQAIGNQQVSFWCLKGGSFGCIQANGITGEGNTNKDTEGKLRHGVVSKPSRAHGSQLVGSRGFRKAPLLI